MVKCQDCQEELGDPIEDYEHVAPGHHRIIWKKSMSTKRELVVPGEEPSSTES